MKYSIQLLKEFKEKYGTRGISEIVEELLKKAPTFPEEQQISAKLGFAMADLESLLMELYNDVNVLK